MSHSELDTLQDQLSQAAETFDLDPALTFKSMFGGVCAYIEGRVFASLSDVGLAFKLSPADQITLLQEPEAKRLQYEPSMPPSKQYIVVPPAYLGDTALLAPWLKRSVDYVLSQPAPKPKVKKLTA